MNKLFVHFVSAVREQLHAGIFAHGVHVGLQLGHLLVASLQTARGCFEPTRMASGRAVPDGAVEKCAISEDVENP
jgi:hypothetical protein